MKGEMGEGECEVQNYSRARFTRINSLLKVNLFSLLHVPFIVKDVTASLVGYVPHISTTGTLY
jgi:hypothetical protein